VNPDTFFALITLTSARWGSREELGVGHVCSALRTAGFSGGMHTVDPRDPESIRALSKTLGNNRPRLVGLSCSHASTPISQLRAVTDSVRSSCPHVHVTAGGYFATFNARRLLQEWPELDSVVVGEGELTIVDLARHLRDRSEVGNCLGLMVRTKAFMPRHPVRALDDLPWAARDIEGLTDPSVRSISTSRGCLAHCTFCNVPAWTRQHGGGWRGRSPQSVVGEMRELHYRLGARSFWIVDSSFEDPWPASHERLKTFANLLIEAKLGVSYFVFFRAETICTLEFTGLLPLLKRSGLLRVFVGIESASDTRLRRYAKAARARHNVQALSVLRTHEIAVRAGWIMFAPETSLEDLDAQVDQLESLGLLHSTIDLFTQLELYSGAAEVQRLQNLNLLTGDPWNNPFAYRFVDPRVEPFARAMRTARDDAADRWDGEAIHSAELALMAVRRILDKLDENLLKRFESVQQDLSELRSIQSGLNRCFFGECLELAAGKWSDAAFKLLINDYVDGKHSGTAELVRRLATSLILDLNKRGIDVQY